MSMVLSKEAKARADLYAECAKSLPEKIGFIEDGLRGAPPDFIVDFGCGDGSLLAALYEVFPEAAKWGVERDGAARQQAAALLRSVHPFLSDVTAVRSMVFAAGWCGHGSTQLAKERPRYAASLLIMSSVLHEQEDIVATLKEAASYGFKYVAIRDFDLAHISPYSILPTARELNVKLRQRWPAENEVYFRDSDGALEEDILLTFRNYRPRLLRRTRPAWIDEMLRVGTDVIPVGFTTHLEVVLERVD